MPRRAKRSKHMVKVPKLELRDTVQALSAISQAVKTLKEFGWRVPDETSDIGWILEIVEPESTVSHVGFCDELGYWISDEIDSSPSRPLMVRRINEIAEVSNKSTADEAVVVEPTQVLKSKQAICPACGSEHLAGLMESFWVPLVEDGEADGQWSDWESCTEVGDKRMCYVCDEEFEV